MTDTEGSPQKSSVPIARWRLLALRALYLLIAAGLGAVLWPTMLAQAPDAEHFHGVTMVMLAAFSLLCLLGVRYPLAMLPVLLWETLWKALWLAIVALPRWQAGTIDAAIAATLMEFVPMVLVLAVVPWDHVLRCYVLRPAERAARSSKGRDANSELAQGL